MDIEPEVLRGIILGQIPYRRCPDCDGVGTEYWIEYTLKERPHDSLMRTVTAQQASDFCLDDWPDYDWGGASQQTCETCEGVGYISNQASLPAYMESFFSES
jgi:hypothetical protein